MYEQKFSFIEHLEEARNCIIKSILFLLITTGFCYSFASSILTILVNPVRDFCTEKLVFISPQEAFITHIKISFAAGLFFALPFILFQIWKFVSSGLQTNEKKYVMLFAPFSFVLFIIGACFGYFIIVPIGLKFLLGFATDFLMPMLTISKYISFIIVLTINFGLVFELPLILMFLTKIGIVTPQLLSSKRKHAIVLLFIAAALFTPPDVITQCLMALPLLLLYELGIIFSKIANKETSVASEYNYPSK